ncbi:MAG: CRISPR-associated helicase Cas3' [Thermoproteota archaeon]
MANMEHSCSFFSHPRIFLKDHLKEVGEQCRKKAIEIGIKNNDLLDIIEIIGKFHDIGKYSKFFQDYLSYPWKGNKELARHSALSALFSSWLISKIYRNPFLSAVAFYSVYRHHNDLADNLYNVFSKDYINDIMFHCEKQLSSLMTHKQDISREISEIMHSLNIRESGLTLDDFIEDYEKGLPILKDIAKNFVLEYETDNIFRDFYMVCLMFSLLIDFDKKVAGKICVPEGTEYSEWISSSLIDTYVNQLSIKDERIPMDDVREEIRRSVLKTFERLVHCNSIRSCKIMTITAPTGSGKTLLSLSIAARIRELVEETKPKIIYVLPYVNIVEQTYDIFKNVLRSEDINLLLKHHHKAYSLAQVQTEALPVEDILLLTESWDSEVIVTTFVQFFETLLGWRNRMLKKFNELFNSIIILDEVQTLPIEYWRLLKEALESLINSSKSYLIYMSATRPIIFEGKELVEDYETYFRRLKRVKFKYIPYELPIDDAARFIFNKWKLKGSLLVVLNTIKSSIEFYEAFKQLLLEKGIRFSIVSGDEEQIDENGAIISYLSTNIIPLHRLNRIKRVKELLKSGKTVVLISTQAVEAGVDLDFDMAARDIGPFDSIVQVAGRCNRNASRKKGIFYILRIIDEKGQLYAKRVYGRLSIEISEKILDKPKEFDEAKILKMISDYYKESIRVFGDKSDEYNEIIKSIENLNFEGLRAFRIIEEEPKYPVFIEYDETAKRIKNEFLSLINERKLVDKDLMYEMLAKIRIKRAELENYIVETWFNIENLPVLNEQSGIKYVCQEEVEKWYNKETGLTTVETEPILL